MRRPAAPPAVLALLAVLGAPGAASAYEERVHQLIGERALPATMPRDLARATPADVDELRGATWRAGAEPPRPRRSGALPLALPVGAAVRRLGLEGVPRAHAGGPGGGRRRGPRWARRRPAPAAVSSRLPDDDKRNVERFAHDPDRRVRRDATGQPLPLDPAQLDMGALTGLSSQAWAHYGLPRVEFSDSPDVLKADPRRWA